MRNNTETLYYEQNRVVLNEMTKVLTLIYIVFLVISFFVPISSYTSIMGVICTPLAWFVLNYKNNYKLAANIVLSTLLITYVVNIFINGGMSSPALIWMPPYSLVAFYLLDKRLGIYYSILGAIAMVTSAAISSYIEFPALHSLDGNTLEYRVPFFASILSVSIVVFTFSLFFISNKKRMLEELDIKNEDLKRLLVGKSHLISIMTHDIRNPLTVILGYNESMKEEVYNLGLPEQELSILTRSIKIIEKSSERIETIIVDALDYEAITRGIKAVFLEPTRIGDIVGNINELFSAKFEAKNIRLNFEIEDIEKEIIIHRTTFVNNIVGNILSNSLKFSDPGSQVIVGLKKENPENICFYIQDYGPGIPKEILKKLFTVTNGKSRKGTHGEPGTGFGMPIVKSYLDKYKIAIKINTEVGLPNNGTTMSLIIPD